MTVTDAAERTPATARRRRAGLTAACVAVGAIVVAWWAWPSWSGGDEQLGVLLVTDPFLARGQRSIELRVRENGRSVAWVEVEDGWCDDPTELARRVEERSPERFVVTFADGEECAPALADALEGTDLVAVVQPGTEPDAAGLAAAGYDVVDPERLVGRPIDDPRRACAWWETCDDDGRIAVRDESGELTDAGHERLARMIVAAL